MNIAQKTVLITGANRLRSHVPVHGRGLAQWRGQDARAPVRDSRGTSARRILSKGITMVTIKEFPVLRDYAETGQGRPFRTT